MLRGILYFFGNVFRIILLFILAFVIYMNKDTKISSDGILLWVFILGGGYSYVIGSFNIGEYKVTLIGEGFSFGLAFLLYFLTYIIANYILSHAAFFCGFLLACLIVNRSIETFRFKDDIPMFFNVTGFIYIGLILLSTIFCFCSKIGTGLGIFMLSSPLELINFTVRSFKAYDVLDY